MPELRMALLAAAFATGILAAEYLGLAACAGVTALLLLAAARLRTCNTPAVWIAAAVMITGAARYSVSRQVAADDISSLISRVTAFEGTVASDPEPRRDRAEFVVRVSRAIDGASWTGATGRVLVSVYERDPRVQYGDRVRINAAPYRPSGPTNPGDFCYQTYLARQGVHSCASLRDPSRIQALGARGGSRLVRAAMHTKHWLASAIAQSHGREESSLAVGILLGTYSHLPPARFRQFSSTGTLHILAASGYNCVILILIAACVLRPLRVGPRWRSLAMAGLIGFYVLMVGPKPSLVRASLMCSLVLLAGPLGRAVNYRNIFFSAALLVLVISPSDLFDAGFQLSFASVWALLSVSPIIEQLLLPRGASDPHRPRRLTAALAARVTSPLTGALVGTVAITVATAPIVAYHFSYVSLTAIPANVAVALLIPVVFGCSLAAAAFGPVPYLGEAVGSAGSAAARGVLDTVGYFGSLEWSCLAVASPGLIGLVGYYLTVYAALAYVRSRFESK